MFKQIWEKLFLKPKKENNAPRGEKLRDVEQDDQDNKSFIGKVTSWC